MSMYLRTTSRKNRDGTKVEYYQLAHNRRSPVTGKIEADIIHNFGRADHLDRDVLARLCRSIARVCGLTVVDPVDVAESVDTRGVKALQDGVRLMRTLPLGPTYAIEQLWERLELGPTLRRLAADNRCPQAYERALLAMTANRLCEPESKLGVWDRWLPKVYLPSCQDLKLDQMYEAMDLLHAHSAKVEEAVFFQTADLLNLDVDLVFYDTTTASFSIDYDDEGDGGLRKRGRPKQGGWSVQVIVALAVTRDGVPVRSWVLPGNTSDTTTVERVKADLRGWKLGRALFVADSGLNCADSRLELARACGKYVLAARAGSVKEVHDQVLGRTGRYREIADNLRVKEVIVGDGERRRRYIVCHNPHEEQRQRLHRQQVVAELEEKLASHPDRTATAKWAIELLASGRYGRYLAVTKAGRLGINRKAISAAARFDGKWVLQTNDDTLSVEDAATAYKGLLVIERCFRSLKTTQIHMTPMYHWLARRIEAHVKICVMALLVQRVAELACDQPWKRIHGALDSLQVTEFRSNSHRFFHRNEVSPEARSVLKSLDISVPKQVLDVERVTPKT